MQPYEQAWHQLSEEALSGMIAWREEHPKATFNEIEEALDERLATLRTRMLQDAAMSSTASDWSQAAPEERPLCPLCGNRLVARGKKSRRLLTKGGKEMTLSRSYGVCPTCASGFFPPR